jgi:hypothetical protein
MLFPEAPVGPSRSVGRDQIRLESLAVALSRTVNVGQGALALSELIAEFQKNEKTLHLIARQSVPGNAPEQRLVILVDQFEEVFTLCRNEELREALICNLINDLRLRWAPSNGSLGVRLRKTSESICRNRSRWQIGSRNRSKGTAAGAL